ncbi:phospholipase A2-like [Liolophura sinensis]|uniref:phospholipase A2-like n=1 Tax=Liolophura sinensis TaxID=3198878 RepID=UPI003157F53D
MANTRSKDVHRKYWSKRVHPKDWSQKDSSKEVYPRDWSIQVHHKDWYRTVHQKDWFKKIRPTEWLSDIGSAFHYSKVYPGTNWCGDGHRAKNWADLGRKWRPDTCCRSHDLCSHAVEAGKVKYGIKNHGPFTWSHCDCDREFYDCLKQARTIDSDIIGVAYFDVLNNYCIYEDYPETCKKFLLFKVKCSKVKTKSKIWKKRKIDLVYFGKARD